VTVSDKGTTAGIGDLTASGQSLLTYVFTSWLISGDAWAAGDLLIVRYADDALPGFEH